MRILIIGCSSGIGLETLKYIYKNSEHQIVALSHNLNSSDEITSLQNRKRILFYEINLQDNDSIKTAIDFILEKKLWPDVVIYNAGLLYNKKFTDFTDEVIDALFAVNFLGYAKLLQNLLVIMPEKQVHFLSIVSMAAVQGSVKFPGLSYYSASKAALAALTESLASEYGETLFRFNSLALGAVQTKMLEEAFPGYKAPVSASEMAEFIAWFALNGNRFFNGKIIPVALSTP